MATYAIDVTNARVRDAMEVLGVEDSELEIKTPAAFAGPHVTADIQNLRYEYYTRKVAETVKQIKHRMKEERMRQTLGSAGTSQPSLRATTSRTQLKSATLSSFLQQEDLKLDQLKERQKEKIAQTLASLKPEKEAVKLTPAELKAQQVEAEIQQEELEKKREMLEKRKKRHEEKLQTIQQMRKEKERELVRSLKQSMKEHEERERKQEENKVKEVRARALSLELKHIQATEKITAREATLERILPVKLNEIEDKIVQKRQLHSERIQQRIEAAQKWASRADTKLQQQGALKEEVAVERIRQYARDQKEARERKGELTKEQQEKFKKEKEKIDLKLAKIKELQKKQKQEEFTIMKEVEKRMRESNKVIEKKQQDWQKQLEIRQELQRLHDEDKRTKVERAQRRYVSGK
jgi:hypothetical protein